MGFWFSQPAAPSESGKFRHVPPTGLQRGLHGTHEDWTYELVRHQSGTTVRRTVYHVTIYTPLGSRAAYLTNFSSANQATTSAKTWISETKARAAAEKARILQGT